MFAARACTTPLRNSTASRGGSACTSTSTTQPLNGYGSGNRNWNYDMEDDPHNVPNDDVLFDPGATSVFVDVATGAVEHELWLPDAHAQLAFRPGGDRIVISPGAGVAAVDNDGTIHDVK